MAAILKIVFGNISTIYCPINANLVRRSRIMLRHKIPNFKKKSRWRTAIILKMVLSLYLSQESSDFNDFWYADANFNSKNIHMTKYQNIAHSKWWTAAIMKIVFCMYLNDLLSN